MEVRQITNQYYSDILSIAEALPEWFDRTARDKSIPIDLKHQKGFMAIVDGRVVGFITVFIDQGRLNIGWLAVLKEYQRKGVGTQLLCKAEQLAKELGISELATYTLGESVDYKPYEQTRRFYFKNGFRVYQRNKTDNESCPEQILISKKIK